MDLLAYKNRVDALLGYACVYLDRLGINSVFYQVVVDHPYQSISRRHGFLDSRSRPKISLDSTESDGKKSELPFLKQTSPSQVYFNYATTI